MTFTEIVTEITDRLNLSSATDIARVGRGVNRIYRKLTASLGLQTSRRAVVQEDATIGVRYITFDNIERIISIADRSVTPERVLTEVAFEELRGVGARDGDDPRVYAINRINATSVEVYLDVNPQTAFTLYADAIETVSTLSGSDVPAFPVSFHDILVEGVLADEYRKREKSGLAAESKGEYEQRLGELRLELVKSTSLDVYQGKTSVFGGGFGGAGGGGSSVNGALSYTQTGLITFDRNPLPPFAVVASSAKVDNLDADMVDGVHITDIASTEILVGTSASNVGSTPALTFDTSSGAKILEVSGVDSISLGAGELGGGFLTCTGTLTIATFTSPGVTFTGAAPITLDYAVAAPEILASNHDLHLASNTNVRIQVDKNNNSGSTFQIINGASAEMMSVTEGGTVLATGALQAAQSTAIPAGGNTSVFLALGSTAGFGVYIGSGAPGISAPKGSLYLRSDGTGINDRAYIATSGAGAWTAIVTVA